MAAEILIITNPVSGRGKALRLGERAALGLREAGRSVDLAHTAARGDARRLAAQAVANGVRLVASCGGDGTVQEIASVLAGTGAALGLLPVGRCNDFARALGFPPNPTAESLTAVLLKGATRQVDVGVFEPLAPAASDQAEKRIFCTVATLGFDSEVTRFVDQRRLPFKGTPAYLYGVLRTLLSFRAPQVELEGDFGKFAGRILLVATGNSAFYGGAMEIAPGARLDDGCFHLCLVQAVPRLTVLRILPKVFKGRHVTHPAVRLMPSRALTIQTPEGPQWICADGENLGQTPARLTVWAGALKVVVAA